MIFEKVNLVMEESKESFAGISLMLHSHSMK